MMMLLFLVKMPLVMTELPDMMDKHGDAPRESVPEIQPNKKYRPNLVPLDPLGQNTKSQVVSGLFTTKDLLFMSGGTLVLILLQWNLNLACEMHSTEPSK